MNKTLIWLNIKADIPFSREREFLDVCLDLVKIGRLEIGCLGYSIRRDLEQTNSYSILIEWDSKEKLNAYLKTRDFGALLGAVKTLSNKVVIDMNQVVKEENNETIYDIRREPN